MKHISFILSFLLLVALSASAQNELKIVQLPRGVNTVGNESAVTIVDGSIYYSQLPHADTSGRKLELDAPLMQIMTAKIDGRGVPSSPYPVKGLNSSKEHVGNTAYDSRNGVLFFTRCETATEGRTPCAIYTAQRKGNKWKHVRPLGKEVNLAGYTSTQPAIAYLPDGRILLYFSSNRPGGLGGMDLWYTIVSYDGTAPTVPTNLGTPINSGYDEITPFYDGARQVLYYSSDRSGGYGGFDIYASNGSMNSYCKPVLLTMPLNSPQNDIGYMMSDSLGTRGYFSSNREGALYAVTPYCCNDLYLWDNPPVVEQPEETKPKPADTLPPVAVLPPDYEEPKVPESPIPSPHNPITLYFHNDQPDPGSIATTTQTRYDQTVESYMKMLPQYKAAWATRYNGRTLDSASAALDNFFREEVKGNYDRLEKFMWIIAEQLWNGHSVTVTIRGYASPLFNSDYNANLSQRRISCFMNYLRGWNQGNLRHSIADGSLRIIQVPYGSSTAKKNVSDSQTDQIHSVYSVEAALERRVEIIDYATD